MVKHVYVRGSNHSGVPYPSQRLVGKPALRLYLAGGVSRSVGGDAANVEDMWVAICKAKHIRLGDAGVRSQPDTMSIVELRKFIAECYKSHFCP